MTSSNEPITIKRYTDRLYEPGAARYVGLEDLVCMIEDGEDFVVVDAKSGEDVTRFVLQQIISERAHG